MKRLEKFLAKLPQPIRYHLMKVERPLRRIRNELYGYTSKGRELIYKGFDFQYPHVSYFYKVGNKIYKNRLFVDAIPQNYFIKSDPEFIENILLHIGLSFVPELFRLYNIDSVYVDSRSLPHESKIFFENYYLKGLAELRYRNALPLTRPIKLVFKGNIAAPKPSKLENKPIALALNGGGKESIVVAELLKEMDLPFIWFTFGADRIKHNIDNVIRSSGINEALNVEWQTDLRIGKEVRFRGSLPFLVPVSFISLLFAQFKKCKYIMVGNEYSSSFGNFVYRDFEINHQYSKSFEFETNFNDYVRRNIIKDIKYVSLVRPFYEILIAKIFSSFKQYFDHFISCNGNWMGINTGRWCKGCPKCAFVFLVLYPFLTDDEIVRIFGEDLFQKKIIRKHIIDLCMAKIKPFECVGTKKESRLALYLSLQKNPELNFVGNPSRNDLESCCLDMDINFLKKECLESFHEPHNIPGDLIESLHTCVEKILAAGKS